MIRSTVLFLLFTTATSFTTPTYSKINTLHRLSSTPTPLEIVDDNSATNSDPFDSYDSTTLAQKTIAFKDLSLGSGTTVLNAKTDSNDSQLLQLQYTAKLMNSKFSGALREFDTPSMVFQSGQQRCLPGLEEGIVGMKVGGRRLVRVPPNKGYGSQWYRGVVPPDSHLEFDVTVVKVANGPVEEFQLKLDQFGVERAIGASVCLAYLALSPLIEKSGILG